MASTDYDRTHSFRDYQVSHPSDPLPGNWVDEELDDVALSVQSLIDVNLVSMDTEGNLRAGIVGEEELEPGLFDQIEQDMIEAANTQVAAAAASATEALGHKNTAQASASSAQSSALSASGDVAAAMEALEAAEVHLQRATDTATGATNSATNASNSANLAQSEANRAQNYETLALNWAEKLEGPVQPAPPGWPEAVDDGMFSSKWWAIRARNYVGQYAELYMGAHPLPPTQASNGGPITIGAIYYDETLDAVFFWSGTEWIAIGGGSDHGLLLGLTDDDHPQYLTNARGDLRYAPLAHQHQASDISGLITDHGAFTGLTDDDHPQYLTQARGDARYSLLAHNHDSVYAPLAHLHSAADVTSGVFSPLRLGTGTPDGTKFLRDDGTWQVPAGGGGVSTTDPYWIYVVALLKFDGTDASTSILDETGRAWSVAGNAQLDTAAFKFGSAALLLDGTGDYISTAHDTALSVASGDFTIEAFVRRASTTTLDTISNKRAATSAQEHSMVINATTNTVAFTLYNAGAVVVNITSTATISADGNFHHVAATRQGNTVRLFIDGNLEVTGTQSSAPSTNSSPLNVGRDGFDTNRDFHGWIDSYRFTKGICRYVASFSPPTAEFPVGVDHGTLTGLTDNDHPQYALLSAANDFTQTLTAPNVVHGDNATCVRSAPATYDPAHASQWKAGFWDLLGQSWLPDLTSWFWGMTLAHSNNNTAFNYGANVVVRQDGLAMFFRSILNGTPAAWRQVYHNGNLTSGTGAPPGTASEGDIYLQHAA